MCGSVNECALGRLLTQPGFNKVMPQEAHAEIDTLRSAEVPR